MRHRDSWLGWSNRILCIYPFTYRFWLWFSENSERKSAKWSEWLNTTLNFGKSIFWVNDQTISQNASSYTSWTFSAKYAGIVSVEIFPTSTLNTYAQVIYSAYEHYVYGINYNQLIPVGAGLATFPIVPSNIEVRVGNTNTLEAANETVTITYYY